MPLILVKIAILGQPPRDTSEDYFLSITQRLGR